MTHPVAECFQSAMPVQLATLAVPRAALPAVEETIGALGGALWADTKGNPDPVPLEVTLPETVERALLERALAEVCAALGLPTPRFTLAPLPDRDWVAESQKALPPQIAGRFFVHGSHVTEPPPPGLIPLLVEASIAFGTGRHETTQGCLIALTALAEERPIGRALDLGCGSGVLAMAMAKLWPAAEVLAADNDPPSVRVTLENAALNGLADRITAVESEGYGAPALKARAPFELIAANILADPLIAMAPDLARHLAPDGLAVLSGLLRREGEAVLAAHLAQGLVLAEQHDYGDWRTLLLRKPA